MASPTFILFAVCVSFCGCQNSSTENSGKSTVPATGSPLSEVSEEADSPLADDIRRHVWDVEHKGFVLEATVFPKLKATINDGSLSFWKTVIAESAESRVPSDAVETTQIATGSSRFASVSFDDQQLDIGSKESFLQWLDKVRQEFDECKSSLGLVRLIPASTDLNGTFTAVWRLRIAGQDANGPVEVETELALGLSTLTDDIAEQSGWITSVKVLRQAVLKANQSYFAETTERTGLVSSQRYDNWNEEEFVPNTGGVYVTDFDSDGNLDVFVDDFRDGNRLYRGNGDGTFEDVTAASGIDPGGPTRAWTLSCWADLDNDGDDDLINEDRLYENLGDGRFRDVTDNSGLPLTPAAGYAIADYDLDGYLDVYVSHTSAYRIGQQERAQVKWIDDGLGIDNVLLRNLGNWQFEDVTEEMNAGGNGSSCFTAVWLHANNDNKPDLFAINEFGRNSLLLSTPDGPFTETDVDPVFGGFSMGVTAGDYNNDGQTDLYVANMYSKAGNRILANIDRDRYPKDLFRKIEEGTRGSKLYSATSTTEFRTIPESDMYAYIGWAYGPTFADFDNDGWLDIYATAGFKSEERGKPDG